MENKTQNPKPKLYMLIGTPYSGKSYFQKKKLLLEPDTVLVDTDSFIMKMALANNISYEHSFHQNIKSAEKAMYRKAMEAVSENRNIIWDQTNLTVKSRAKKLILFPDHYEKNAIIFEMPRKKELRARIFERKDMVVSMEVIDRMFQIYSPPTYREGFDNITKNGKIAKYIFEGANIIGRSRR